MSLLEDVFLEDEAGEAQELERVIEGDEFDERPRTPNSDENSEREDEAEEDKRRVDHTAKAKRVVKNPRFILNPARLTGPRGIQIIPEHFKDFKFKGKGHEREDLDMLLKKLEHWAYRLYPKFKFDDCLKKIETLGKKRPVMVHLHKIRTDQYMSEDTIVQKDSSGDEAETAPVPQEDEFDRLLQQQIELARSTPAPGSVRKELYTPITPVVNRSPLVVPKVSSSPSISDEQKERMIRNRKLAEERRLTKLSQLNNTSVYVGNHPTSTETGIQENDTGKTVKDKVIVNDAIVVDNDKDENEITVVRKLNRSNIIDSSDEEDDVLAVNESITVDVHNPVYNVVKDIHSDTNNTERHVGTSEDIEYNINRADGEIETNKEPSESIKDTVTEVALNKNKKIDTSDDTGTLEIDTNSNNIEEESICYENDLYCVKTPNLPDDKNNDDKALSNEEENDKSNEDESTQKEKEVAHEKVPEPDNLMDVDFSDDF